MFFLSHYAHLPVEQLSFYRWGWVKLVTTLIVLRTISPSPSPSRQHKLQPWTEGGGVLTRKSNREKVPAILFRPLKIVSFSVSLSCSVFTRLVNTYSIHFPTWPSFFISPSSLFSPSFSGHPSPISSFHSSYIRHIALRYVGNNWTLIMYFCPPPLLIPQYICPVALSLSSLCPTSLLLLAVLSFSYLLRTKVRSVS